jgi:hypothetical protein
MRDTARVLAAVLLGLVLGSLPLVRYRFAAPHAGHAHPHAPAPHAPGKE